MYVCRQCQQPINSASEICPYCGAEQNPTATGVAAKDAKKRSSARIAMLLAIAVAAIWAIIWFATPMRMQSSRADAEKAAASSLNALQKELAAYANGTGTFPPSLETLGEPARDAAREAMSGGYSLRYAPGPADTNGNVHAYSLVAMPRNYGYRSFFVDQTGVIRATRENRAATAQDSPI